MPCLVLLATLVASASAAGHVIKPWSDVGAAARPTGALETTVRASLPLVNIDNQATEAQAAQVVGKKLLGQQVATSISASGLVGNRVAADWEPPNIKSDGRTDSQVVQQQLVHDNGKRKLLSGRREPRRIPEATVKSYSVAAEVAEINRVVVGQQLVQEANSGKRKLLGKGRGVVTTQAGVKWSPISAAVSVSDHVVAGQQPVESVDVGGKRKLLQQRSRGSAVEAVVLAADAATVSKPEAALRAQGGVEAAATGDRTSV